MVITLVLVTGLSCLNSMVQSCVDRCAYFTLSVVKMCSL
jgi:hypothetical protein